MASKCMWTVGAAGAFSLFGCQTNLPPLETAPNGGGLKIQNVVDHIQCELAQIVNQSPENPQLAGRVADAPMLGSTLLSKLADDHFVASAQLSLEVTDTDGLTPSLSFINKAATLSIGVGGQLNGTQDRNVSINYAIDLYNLKGKEADYCKPFSGAAKADFKAVDGIGGDLGLSDTVTDGLLALDASSNANAYSSNGPIPPPFRIKFNLPGAIKNTSGGALATIALDGTILVSPHSANSSTSGTVTITGLTTVIYGSSTSRFIVNWSGTLLPPDSTTSGSSGSYYFSVATGNLFATADTDPSNAFVQDFGRNPSVIITGSIDKSSSKVTMQGAVSGTPLGGTQAKTANIEFSPTAPHSGTALSFTASSTPAKTSAASAGSAGATSFGSLITFTLVYGANGSPNWMFKTFKGPTGSNSLVSLSRTHTDSLSISFVATCRDWSSSQPVGADYWSTIAYCDDLPSAVAQSAQFGYQNNSLMILKSLTQRPNPGGGQP